MLKKNLFKILLYLSLGFFIYFLYRLDYLVLGQVKMDPWYLILSLGLLFIGFVFSAISWWFILKKHDINISPAKAISSHGIYVFAKYIPGKLWVIVGRAGLVQGFTGNPLRELSFISLKEQFTYTLLGLMLSVIPVFLLFGPGIYSLIIVLTLLGLALMLFSPAVHRMGLWLMEKLFRKTMEIPIISFSDFSQTALVVLSYWVLWSAGFYFLLVSIFGELPLITAFAFPLSVSFGVLAIVMPGGIGVRESIIVGYLVSTGVSLDMAITISVISRLWFVAGELFFFLLALVLRWRQASGYL